MKILEWLQEEGSARVRDLAAAFGVFGSDYPPGSRAAGRWTASSRASMVGRISNRFPQQVETMTLHHVQNMDRKQRIGMAAASLIGNNETIIIDSGTTTTQTRRKHKESQRAETSSPMRSTSHSFLAPFRPIRFTCPAGQFQGADPVAEWRKVWGFFRWHLCRETLSRHRRHFLRRRPEPIPESATSTSSAP